MNAIDKPPGGLDGVDAIVYAPRQKLITQKVLDELTAGWAFSNAVKNGSANCGSLLENEYDFQKRVYLKFEPPKKPHELNISHNWRYEAPKLSSFAEQRVSATRDSATGNTPSTLTPAPLATLKQLATNILSGTTQESLVNNSYMTAVEAKGSSAGDRDGAASILSMPINTSGESATKKRSILELLKKNEKKGRH